MAGRIGNARDHTKYGGRGDRRRDSGDGADDNADADADAGQTLHELRGGEPFLQRWTVNWPSSACRRRRGRRGWSVGRFAFDNHASCIYTFPHGREAQVWISERRGCPRYASGKAQLRPARDVKAFQSSSERAWRAQSGDHLTGA